MKKQQMLNSITINFKETAFLPNDAAKGLFMFLISQTLITLAYQILYMIGFVQSVWSYVFTLLLDACFIGVVYNIAKTKKIDFWSAIRAKRAPKLKEVFIALAIALVCIFGFSAITNLFMELLYSFGYSSVSSDITISSFGYYILYVVLICVVPAVAEEILFRGLIANGLKRISVAVCIFGSSFLFMIMHGSPDQTMHQFILGIVLALVFLVSDNIWVSILVHFFNNFIAVTFAYLTYSGAISKFTFASNMFLTDAAAGATPPVEDAVYSISENLGEYVIYAVISAIISGCLLYLLLKALSNVKRQPQDVSGVELKTETNVNKWDGYDISSQFQEEYRVVEGDAMTSVQTENEEMENSLDPPNKLSGSGRTMFIISIAWLVIDWLSALVLGLTSL